jgi:hypothetical protein
MAIADLRTHNRCVRFSVQISFETKKHFGKQDVGLESSQFIDDNVRQQAQKTVIILLS